MKLPKYDWWALVRELGLIAGFVSIFLVWLVGNKYMFTTDLNLTFFLDPDYFWGMLQEWPYVLAPIGALFFIGGCVMLLFTRYGVIAQALGLIAFLALYLSTYEGTPSYSLGIGFYAGVLSAFICAMVDFVVKGTRFSWSQKTVLKQ